MKNQILNEEFIRMQKLAGILRIQEQEITPTQDQTVTGQIRTDLYKKLDITNFSPSKFSAVISLVKQNKALNISNTKILADVMIALIKTNDDKLLTQIFSNLKQLDSK